MHAPVFMYLKPKKLTFACKSANFRAVVKALKLNNFCAYTPQF